MKVVAELRNAKVPFTTQFSVKSYAKPKSYKVSGQFVAGLPAGIWWVMALAYPNGMSSCKFSRGAKSYNVDP